MEPLSRYIPNHISYKAYLCKKSCVSNVLSVFGISNCSREIKMSSHLQTKFWNRKVVLGLATEAYVLHYSV